MAARIFRYVLASDTGMAPCPAGGRITLATCKPKIRASAGIGDWVISYLPKRLGSERVAWVGRVDQVVGWEEYERLHRRRPDAVYRIAAAGGVRRLARDYHDDPKQIARDLSAPVLIFDCAHSRYFGRDAVSPPATLRHLQPAGQGHRVAGSEPEDGARLTEWVTHLAPGPGLPRDAEAIPSQVGGIARGCGRRSLPPRPCGGC